MPPSLISPVDATCIYLGLVLLATTTYTIILRLKGLTASLLHTFGWGSTYAILWPASSCILTVLGLWWGFLPHPLAFPISAIITILPATAVTSATLKDIGSSPLARKADRPPPPPTRSTVPPPSSRPEPQRVRPKWG